MRGVGLALDGRHAGGFGAGRLADGLAAALGGLLLLAGSPDGEVPVENVSISSIGKPDTDNWRAFVAEVREAGGELPGEKGPCPIKVESGGDA